MRSFAFPEVRQTASTPLTAAPAPITDAQRAEAGVDFEPEDDEA